MPLYEYQCKQCGHRFERIQSFSAAPIKQCPICSGEVEKLISAPTILFKGSGFYATDYGSKPSAKTEQSSGNGSSKAASDGAGSSSEKSSGEKTPAEKSTPAKSEPAASSTPAAKSASG